MIDRLDDPLPFNLKKHKFKIDERGDVQATWQYLHQASQLQGNNTGSLHETSGAGVDEHYRQQMINLCNPPMTASGGSITSVPNAGSSHRRPASTIALTTEGLRQAQTAGDRFRAFQALYGPRDALARPADYVQDQQRWASYQTKSVSWKAPVAEDPTRGPWLEVETPPGQSLVKTPKYDRPKASLECWPKNVAFDKIKSGVVPQLSKTGIDQALTEPSVPQNFLNAKMHADSYCPPSKQLSLLDVFESEFAKNKAIDDENDVHMALQKLGIADPNLHGSKAPALANKQTSQKAFIENFAQHDVPKAFVAEKMTQTPAFPKPVTAPKSDLDPLEEGISKAIKGFEQCLRGVVEVLQATKCPDDQKFNVIQSAGDAMQGLVQSLKPEVKVAKVNSTEAKAEFPEKIGEKPAGHPLSLSPNNSSSKSLGRSTVVTNTATAKANNTGKGPDGAHHALSELEKIDQKLCELSQKSKSASSELKPIAHDKVKTSTPIIAGPSDPKVRFPSIDQLEKKGFASTGPPYPFVDLKDIEVKPTRPKLTMDTLRRHDSSFYLNQLSSDAKSVSVQAEKAESTTPTARLVRPFSAYDSNFPISAPHDGVRRRATVTASRPGPGPSLRRPQSQFFPARNPWLDDDANVRGGTQVPSHGLNRFNPPPGVQNFLPSTEVPFSSGFDHPAATLRAPPGLPAPIPPPLLSSSTPHSRLVEQVNQCTQSLEALGFEGMELGRLRMYAEASGGDLGQALDMIDEDQKAQASL